MGRAVVVLSKENQKIACLEVVAAREALAKTPNDSSKKRAYHKAVSHLVVHNQGLVLAAARRMARMCRNLDWEDLAQAGNIGLLRAAEKFEPARGIEFSTYAGWWLRAYIFKAIAYEDSTIRITEHMLQTRRKLNKKIGAFERQHGRPPTEDELAAVSEYDREQIALAMSVDMQPPASLDATVDSGGGGVRGGMERYEITPNGGPSAEEYVESREREARARELLGGLGDRERRVIFGRYWEEKTLEEIGANGAVTPGRSVSRQRVQQVEDIAFAQLREKCGVKGRVKRGPPFPQSGRGNRSRVGV